MGNNLWFPPNDIKNYMANFGASGRSVTEKEKAMTDKNILATKYLLAQTLQDFDKSDLQNIANNVKRCSFHLTENDNSLTSAIYVSKDNGFFVIILNLGLLLEFNFEIKPRKLRKSERLFSFIQNLFFDEIKLSFIDNQKYQCDVAVNILDPLKKIVNLYDFEQKANKLIKDAFNQYWELYKPPYIKTNVEFSYTFKKSQNTDFPLFNDLANGDKDVDDYLPTFYVLVKDEVTTIKNYLRSEQHIAIEIVKEWSGYTNYNKEFEHYPISKRLNDRTLEYTLDVSIKKYVGIPVSLKPDGDIKGNTIVTFYNIDTIYREDQIARHLYSDGYSLYRSYTAEYVEHFKGYQYYSTAKAYAREFVENEITRFKADYEQYIKEFADFINVFKLGAENLANDLLDTHLNLRNDFKEKLEDIDHKLSTIEVI